MNEFMNYIVGSVAYSLLGFLAGWIVGREAQVIEEIREAVIMDETKQGPYRRKGFMGSIERWNSSKFLGVVVVCIALFTMLQTAYFTYEQRAVTQCLSNYNAELAHVQNVRAEWADEDRDAMIAFFEIYQPDRPPPPPTVSEREQGFEDLIATYNRNTMNREENPLPSLETCE